MNAKAVLFVDNHQPQFLKIDTVLKQRMGANQNIDLATGQSL